MKLLVFSSLYPNAEQTRHGIFVEQRVRRLHEAGIDASVVAPVPWFPSSHAAFGHYARLARVPAHDNRHGMDISYPRYPVVPRVGMTIAPALMAAALLPAVKRHLRQHGGDMIDAHYFYPDGVAAVWIGRRLKLPVAVSARGSDINVIGEHRLPKRMIVWAANNAATVVTVSEALRRRMAGLGVDERRIHVLRNGVDLKLFHPGEDEAGHALAPETLLSVGNLTENKGHHLVIDAMAQLPDNHLLIVGEGAMRGELQRRAEARGVGARVQFRGVVSQETLRGYYASASLLVLASASEGMPNVVLESLACGTPVVATDVGGIPEVMTAPEAGMVIHERTASAIVSAVTRVMARRASVQQVRAFAEQFGWPDTTRQQIALYRRVVEGPSEK